jgi:hypothetical protein
MGVMSAQKQQYACAVPYYGDVVSSLAIVVRAFEFGLCIYIIYIYMFCHATSSKTVLNHTLNPDFNPKPVYIYIYDIHFGSH